MKKKTKKKTEKKKNKTTREFDQSIIVIAWNSRIWIVVVLI